MLFLCVCVCNRLSVSITLPIPQTINILMSPPAGRAEAACQKWQRLCVSWQQRFLIDPDNQQLGSWLDTRFDDNNHLCLGCKVCASAGIKHGNFALYQVKSSEAMQAVNFQKHQDYQTHKAAAVAFINQQYVAITAPPADMFDDICTWLLKGSGVADTAKKSQMVWCLSEAIKATSQSKLAEATNVALFRDEGKGRLAVRARVVAKDLDVTDFTVGHTTNHGTGALAITKGTVQIMKRFCSRFAGAPGKPKQVPFVKKTLFKKFRNAVTTITVDSAADEVLSSEMMRSSTLCSTSRRILPNLKFVIRDKCHGSRRLMTRTLAGEPFLIDVMKHFVRSRGSIARLIHNSRAMRQRFELYIKTSYRGVDSYVKNMRSAPHRYESLQKPFGRSVLFLHGCILTGLWAAQTRSDELSKNAKHFLTWLTDERCLQAAMLADASDQCIALTRFLDTENVDPAQVNEEVRSFIKSLESLFCDKEKCLSVFGYTQTMLQTLQKPIVFQFDGKVYAIGSDAGVSRAVIDQCLVRMRAWFKLVLAVVAVEFPSFELCHVPCLNLGM